MRPADLYQYALILLGVIATAFFSVFFMREVNPEYRLYQDRYVELEKFRSTQTGEAPPDFKIGVKQIVFEPENKGPPLIDRCVSCHVATQIPDFSPVKIAKDINGNILYDASGIPVKVKNENYIWDKLDQKIAELTDSKVLEQLKANAETSKIKERLAQAEQLKSIKTANEHGVVYDVTKVLSAHPLIGRATRPFEFHSLEEYGCTVCHNGNGRGLTTEKAHGPVFDGEYEIEFIGPEPEFTEPDPKNDPAFARAYNHKPGHELLFQTTPIFVGALIQAKCVQCHQTSESSLNGAIQSATRVTGQNEKRRNLIQTALNNETQTLISLLQLKQDITKQGVKQTIESLDKKAQDFSLPTTESERYASQALRLKKLIDGKEGKEADQLVLAEINNQMISSLGSAQLAKDLETKISAKEKDISKTVDVFLVEQRRNSAAKGSIFLKMDALDLESELLQHVSDVQSSYQTALRDPQAINALQGDVDFLTKDLRNGRELFISQACYACHRISAFSRGGVGPELTRIGNYYPWYIKKKMVWPQFDLKTSTMPNMNLDHAVTEDLMAYLMSQTGSSKAISESVQKITALEWEAGKKQIWEEAAKPSQIHDLNYSMTVFATQGCAACHRLRGFESDIGYSVEKGKEKVDFDTHYKESQWFTSLIPETIIGSDLVAAIEKNSAEIDRRIQKVREGSLLEKIESEHPDLIESFYSPFAYAFRAKNAHFAELANAEADPAKRDQIWKERDAWQKRVRNVLMVYVQEYGLGRLIGPRPNWSGIFRSDEWLMEHFWKPSSHVANSIMPVLPFDDTKFYALTYMLDKLGIRNRDAVKEIWKNRGFDPEQAYELFCAQCHGDNRNGNGPVSRWIYPIPKNLRNADFLRNYTKERVRDSLMQGVKGTPMPPWGEVATDKPMADGIPVLTPSEINQLTEWLFSTLPGSSVIKGTQDVPKWQYTPEDVIRELKQEGGRFQSDTSPEIEEGKVAPLGFLPNGENLYASLNPVVNSNANVGDIFDIRAPPVSGGTDQHGYYIKKKFYTPENIEEGRRFFHLNCAICHGTEADGRGVRAEVMQDAKPRMLTNLDWLDTRDDLRLIRSIKYGVPGTAMNPWGDLTSSLQRLQLVMFIRTLSEEQKQRTTLQSRLYRTFETTDFALENARSSGYEKIDAIQKQYDEISRTQENLLKKVESGAVSEKDALDNYQKKIALSTQLKELKETDNILTELKTQINKEHELYQGVGTNLILKPVADQTLNQFIEILKLNDDHFVWKNEKLEINEDPKNTKRAMELEGVIIQDIDRKIAELEEQKTRLLGKISSPELNEELSKLNGALTGYKALKKKVATSFEEAERVRKKQKEIYEEYTKRVKQASK